MTKTERLMYLVNMIRNRGPMFVSEMARECEVTQRTIFRDLNSLTKLNFPLYYDNGYRLAFDTNFPSAGLNPVDMQLICYALRNNPMSQLPLFSRRFRAMEQDLRARSRRRSGSNQETLFLFEKRSDYVRKDRETDIIARFLKAIQERRKIVLTLASSRGPNICVPLAVRLKQSGPLLIAATEEKVLIEEPVHNIKTLKLTDEKFTQRPLHLLRRTPPRQKKLTATDRHRSLPVCQN